MKKLFSIIFMVLCGIYAHAQNISEEYIVADSVVYRPAVAIDSTLYGQSIMAVMPSRAKGDRADVNISQSQAISNALKSHIEKNPRRDISGYRVRIFFDNSQNARQASENTLNRFRRTHPEVMAYRSFQSPYFKVTVGDFRTKSEAMELLERIKSEYPSAFILKENISYPVVDKENSFIADTVQVIRRK